ncbi:MAG: tail fiber domain-containing protein [Candidatus Cloacimonetes bacterium]|nr:tail fiber domain-containing protein [Candidatus Cloacimonadota bacterium]
MKLAILTVLLSIFFCGLAAEEALFFVTDAEGDTLFAVYPNGVVIKNEAGDRLFTAESDSIRAYVYEDPDTRTSRGGFAIGGVGSTTRDVNTYFQVCGDSVRIYLEEEDPVRTSRGGFAIGGVGSTTRTSDYYFNLDRSLTPEVIDPSQPRMLWYPAKEAVRMGRVLVESPDSVGTNSMATGYESRAIGDYSQALGYQAHAGGDYSTAIGYMANADSDYSYAFGGNTQALGFDSFALGFGATTRGSGCFALGSVPRDSTGIIIPGIDAVTAEGIASFAIGPGAYANGVGAIAIGLQSVANEYSAIAIGRGAEADGSSATAIGRDTYASGYLSTALGAYTEASGSYSTALGYFNTASGSYSTAMGRQTLASGDYSVAGGYDNVAGGAYSTAFGRTINANADYSFGAGDSNTLDGVYAGAIGRNIIISSDADYSFAAGYNNTIGGSYGFAAGSGNIVDSTNAVALGNDNQAQGNYSVAMGRSNIAGGYAASVMGYSCEATGDYSFAAGRDADATGIGSVALGYTSIAAGGAVAIGKDCESAGYGVAMGYDCTAPGSYSVALGYHADALGQGSVAIGDNAESDNHGVAIGVDVYANHSGVAMGRNASNGAYSGGFVFGDNDSVNPITSDASNQFRARFRGGIKFHTSSDLIADKSVVITGNEGWMGVGTDDPQARLDVVGSGFFHDLNSDVGGTDGVLLKINNTNINTYAMSGIMFQNGTTADTYKGGIFYRDRTTFGRGNMLFCTRNTVDQTNVQASDAEMVIYYNGNVGIGTDVVTTASYKLTVDGRIAPHIDNTYDLGSSTRRWDNVYATNGTIQTSDRRLKERITNLRYGLADLMRLRPVSFRWKDDEERETHLGLIAQEVREIIPEAVVQDTPDDYMGMRYTEIIPVLVSAVQEQQGIIEEQQEALGEKDEQVRELNDRLSRLEEQLAQLARAVETSTRSTRQ